MIIHLFFYRNRRGRIWSNMSSQPKRVFKLGYHIEYYTIKKKNGTFLFHSICHEIQFTEISLSEDI